MTNKKKRNQKKKLDTDFENLKKYHNKKEIEQLNKKIFSLDLSKEFLKSLSQDKLQYIHVKLHNALSYKKPFSKIENIKKAHDVVAKLLKRHSKIDKLDD